MRTIEHKGVVRDITDTTVKVEVVSRSACHNCHAKGVCTLADSREKIIEVSKTSNDFQIGETVNVVLYRELGHKALLLSYVIPFLIVVIGLLVFEGLFSNEVIAGLGAVFILVPYYLGLSFFQKSLRNTFQFSITKIKR